MQSVDHSRRNRFDSDNRSANVYQELLWRFRNRAALSDCVSHLARAGHSYNCFAYVDGYRKAAWRREEGLNRFLHCLLQSEKRRPRDSGMTRIFRAVPISISLYPCQPTEDAVKRYAQSNPQAAIGSDREGMEASPKTVPNASCSCIFVAPLIVCDRMRYAPRGSGISRLPAHTHLQSRGADAQPKRESGSGPALPLPQSAVGWALFRVCCAYSKTG